MEFLKILSNIRNPFFDILFQAVTLLGEELFAVAILCFLFWCRDKKLAYRIAFTYFISGLLIQSLKITFRIPRPWELDSGFQAVQSAVAAATGYSFPSGHTQSAAALFGSLALWTHKPSRKLLFSAAFLSVGFSRMYLGVHTPQDVLVSMAATLVIAWMAARFAEKYYAPKMDTALAVMLCACSVLVLVYTLSLRYLAIVEPHHALDGCKAAGAGLGFALGWFLERKYVRFALSSDLKEHLLFFIPGISTALLLKVGSKAVLGSSIPASVFQYFILILWLIALYPHLRSRFSRS